MRRLVSIAVLGALVWTACKKSADTAPDAAAGPAIVEDSELAFQLELAPEWKLEAQPDGGVSWKLAEARRLPPKGRTYLVAPKFVVSTEPSRAPDVDTVIRQTMNDLRGVEQKGGRVNRSALATRIVDGVMLGDIEIAYELGDKRRPQPVEIVQRSLVTLRPKSDGTNAVWALTVTYLSDDAELVAPEVQQMLATLRFDGAGPKIEPKKE